MIAALFVDTGGCYAGLPDIDLWDESRDARLYAGPYPVVAHPPCARWCRTAGLVEYVYGYKRGADDGCFESALASVRRWGGVLEHPAYTDAWLAYGLVRPHPGCWHRTICGGWVCHVEQGRYGHPARKATWLYAFGVQRLPSLRWGESQRWQGGALVSWCQNRTKPRETIVGGVRRAGDKRRRITKREASSTPVAFRDLLIQMARSAVV